MSLVQWLLVIRRMSANATMAAGTSTRSMTRGARDPMTSAVTPAIVADGNE